MTLEFKSMVRSPNSSRWCDTENTQGEVEAAICKMMSHFEQEYYGRGPNEIRAYLVDNLLIVRLQGVLTAAEKNLVKSADGARARDLIKQFRTQLIEVARPALERLIEDITDVKIVSLHHDISTKTGEEVVLFTLTSSPRFRESKKRQFVMPPTLRVVIITPSKYMDDGYVERFRRGFMPSSTVPYKHNSR